MTLIDEDSQNLKEMSRMATGLAHDFTNILGIIVARVSLMEKELKEHPLPFYKHLNSIRNALNSGKSLVDQLSIFAGQDTLQLEWTDLNSLIHESVEDFLEKNRDVQIHSNLDPYNRSILLDRKYIRIVVQNLCLYTKNSLSHQSEIYLETQLIVGKELKQKFNAAREELYFRLTFLSHGNPIHAIELERVFEPYFTPSGRDEVKLELAVVYGCVQMHQGFIEVESELNKGTRFDIYLPTSSPD